MKNDDRIILLDLNYTLVANSYALGSPFFNRLHLEEYRTELVEAIRDRDVVLITVRPIAFRDATLARIEERPRWRPQEAWFNDNGLRAPECKQHLLKTYVMPQHGSDPSGYFAIESNVETRKMYGDLGIKAKHVRALQLDHCEGCGALAL